MIEKFEKSKLIGDTRRILYEIAAWTENLYDANAPSRLIGDLPDNASAADSDWETTGSAGPVIERSVIIGHVGRVIDCLNTNRWHGDPSNLYLTYRELTPLHGLLESSSVLMSPVDYAVDPDAASSVFNILEIFFARVKLELDHEPLELKELAAIAGLAKKTVRMAAIGQDKNPDLVTFKDGSRTYVKSEEAIRWLAKKDADYRPIDWSEDQLLPPVDPKNVDELGPYLRDLREQSSLTVADLGSRLGWGQKTIQAYEALENVDKNFDADEISFDETMQLSQAICPSESADLIRIVDRILHPIILEKKLSEQLPSSAGQ